MLCVYVFSHGLTGTQSQLNLERSKSRMGTFVEGGPMAETNPDEGYEIETNTVCLSANHVHIQQWDIYVVQLRMGRMGR